ncbi:MAG: saccharopine dehydrogenase C-terminal domain-containing protein [bacterium]
MQHIIVLGTGIVGSAIVKDLGQDYRITAADNNQTQLNKIKAEQPLTLIEADLSQKENIAKIIKDADLVINALPGHLGFNTLKTIIEHKKNAVDIAFFSEDPFQLDELAREKGVTVVIDCGVAPGLSNMITGYHNENMTVHSFECLVGGLPVDRSGPYEYKAPFSPIDVLEEYIRPARLVEKGKMITKPALSDPELIDFEEVGTLESFNTDGLRTLIKTMSIPDMKEKTLRYPGHRKLMQIFRESGFFSKKTIKVNNTEISPLEFTSRLLFPLWKYKENEEDFTIMRITIKGIEKGKEVVITYTLFDTFDTRTNISSMARTTGYTCTAAARLILNDKFKRKGVSPPEYLGADVECFNQIINHLQERDIKLEKKIQSG